MAKEFLKNILVPIDGSDPSLIAEETAVRIAKKTNAAVAVLNVAQEFQVGYALSRAVEDEIIDHFEKQSAKIISDAHALFKEEEVPIQTITRKSSDPAESILLTSGNYDLIIMGAHGENEKDPYALGSVTKKVIRHATCPTLIAKTVTTVSNLLMCVDGSKNALKAFKYAAELAEKLDSKVTLLNVQERHVYDFSPKTFEELGEKTLSDAVKAIDKINLKIDKRLEFGVPSDKIVEVAQEDKHDLIVLGSRGLGTVKRFLLGSISDDVIHKAKCSVLIVPTGA
jgi:nucleotide-binding universal stress UspA family protein